MIRFNCNFYFAKVYIYFLIAPLFLRFYINIWAISTLLHIDLYKIVNYKRLIQYGRIIYCSFNERIILIRVMDV